MSADTLLCRLDAVRRTGADCWIARCPAHDDRRPSLSIRGLPDGRVLVHCWADCATADVLNAVDLDFGALFPERATHHRINPDRRAFSGRDILACMKFEALIVAVAAGNIATGKKLSNADLDRLTLAACRLQAAAEMAHA